MAVLADATKAEVADFTTLVIPAAVGPPEFGAIFAPRVVGLIGCPHGEGTGGIGAGRWPGEEALGLQVIVGEPETVGVRDEGFTEEIA